VLAVPPAQPAGEIVPDPDDQREALKGAVDYTKLLITLATGTVVISATFLDKFYAGKDSGLLIAAWIVLGVSVVVGFLAHGEYIRKLAESNLAIKNTGIEHANLGQFALAIAGVVLFAIFVVSNVTAKPTIRVAREQTGITGRVATTALVCGATATNGCTGSVAFELGGPHVRPPVSLGQAVFATDHPGVINVTAPDFVPNALKGGLTADQLTVHVQVAGRFGNTADVDVVVPAREEPNGG
jgi:hypothetical protein